MSPALNRRWAVGGLLVGFCAIVALVVSLGAGAGTTAVAAAPKNTSPPTITGTAQEGQTLVGDRGQWSGNPTDYNDFWVRCDKDGGSCANISGAQQPRRIRAQECRCRQHDPVQGAGEERGWQHIRVVGADCRHQGGRTRRRLRTGAPRQAERSRRGHLTARASERSTRRRSARARSAKAHANHGPLPCRRLQGSIEGALVYVTAVPYGKFADVAMNSRPAQTAGQPCSSQRSPATRSATNNNYS